MIIAPKLVKSKLDAAISGISDTGWLFAKDPTSDFTRERKLPMKTLLQLLLKFGGKSLQGELSTYYIPPGSQHQTVPTKSAFTTQRAKLFWEACYALLRNFTDSLPYLRTFGGYRLLACDGSTVPIPRNEDEPDYSITTREDRKSYNLLHLNGLFDVMNRIYIDCVIDPGMHANERDALIQMVHRLNNPSEAIVLADRGYEGYKDVTHMIKSKVNFVIRAKDLDSNGFLHTLNLPADGELDVDVNKILTFERSKSIREDESCVIVYRRNFDLISSGETYPIHFRLVRIKLDDGSYECLVTNLPRDKFPPKKLKKLYHLRWGIENAFRDLKFSVDLLHFHGKSAQFVLQEVLCSLVMFNFCAFLCVHADILKQAKDTKYHYKVNFANAVGPCRSFFHESIGEMELLERLRLSPTPIRPDRHVQRPRIKEQSSREFNYRAS